MCDPDIWTLDLDALCDAIAALPPHLMGELADKLLTLERWADLSQALLANSPANLTPQETEVFDYLIHFRRVRQ